MDKQGGQTFAREIPLPVRLHTQIVCFLFSKFDDGLPTHKSNVSISSPSSELKYYEEHTVILSLTSASSNIVGFSLILSVITAYLCPRPAAPRSPVSRRFSSPVRMSMVMMTSSSAQRWTRRAISLSVLPRDVFMRCQEKRRGRNGREVRKVECAYLGWLVRQIRVRRTRPYA